MIALLLVSGLAPAQDAVPSQDAGQFRQEAPAEQGSRVEQAMAAYRERTQFAVTCAAPRDDGEIVVCSRRDADQWRVPFVPAWSADNSAPMREAELTKDYSLMDCGYRATFYHCGSVGVSVTVGADGSTMVRRPIAP
ncbi:MAG: hypothetical protein CMN73_06655 [Sphingomonas sp.]|nr:hypothetical protein [Sphingomonas sp.]|tara:strand:+ start:812 stop:1222 length:411 start_codon:yes stop_codon:yes gene_type:complete